MTKRDGAGQASLAAAAHARCCAQLLSRLAPIIFKPGSLISKLASCASSSCCALHVRPARRHLSCFPRCRQAHRQVIGG